MLRFPCSLAMLNCAWMAQPHAAFQLAHSDCKNGGKMRKKKAEMKSKNQATAGMKPEWRREVKLGSREV